MRSSLGHFALGTVLVYGLTGCGGGRVRAVRSRNERCHHARRTMNHPPGIANVAEIKITFFKKEACNKPNEQGFHCTFDVMVASTNIGRLDVQQYLDG